MIHDSVPTQNPLHTLVISFTGLMLSFVTPIPYSYLDLIIVDVTHVVGFVFIVISAYKLIFNKQKK